MKNIILKIKGMHCKSCALMIKDVLEDETAVESAKVSDKEGAAKIAFDETKITEDKIKSIIKKEGYEVN
jgi:copper chaperone CopZ